MIEANTGFGAQHTANTGFSLSSVDAGGTSVTAWNIGLEGGCFVMDDLAIKLGLGYGDTGIEGFDGTFSYKIGAKYYINSSIPVQIDLNGASVSGFSPMSLGLQGGYAIFLSDTVSIESGVRYDLGLGDAEDLNVFQLNIGFSIFL